MKRVLTESQGQLLRALIRHFTPSTPQSDRQLPSIIVNSWETDDWASLTFAGQRHRIALVVAGAMAATMPSFAGFDVAGAIVAEANIVAATPTAAGLALEIAVMTVAAG